MKTMKIIMTVMMLIVMVNRVQAQYIYQGNIIDQHTNDPLAGAIVVVFGSSHGAISNWDGDFKLQTQLPADSLCISFLGYRTRTIHSAVCQNIALVAVSSHLDQVIVSASREKQQRKDVPIAISTLSPKVLDEAKATTIDQVINKVSGVYMVDLGNEQHSMSIRQPLSYRSLFLYLEDGIPIRTTGVFNHNALIEINMASVYQMEVIKGPASSIYGSEAIGGAVNFITHSPSKMPSAKIQLQANNQGYKRTDFYISNTWNKVGIIASGYVADSKNGRRSHSDYYKTALTFRSDWRVGDKTMWTNAMSYIHYKTDMTGGLDSANFYGQDFSSLHTFTNRKVKALRYRSTIDYYWNDDAKTTVTAFWRDNAIGQNPHYRIKNDYNKWQNTGNPNLAHGEENKNSFRSYGLLAQHRQDFDFLNAIWMAGVSVDYSPNNYYARYIKVDKNNNGIYTGYTNTDSLLADYHVDLLNTAIYMQLELSATDKLKTVAAIRYDRVGYSYDNALDTNASSGAPDQQNQFEQWTPRIGCTYDLANGKGAYANATVGFSPPGVAELYRGVKVPSLLPAKYYNYEVGGWIYFANKKGYFDLSVYQLRGTNEIISVKLDDGALANRNAGQTLHQGIEYMVRYSPTNSWSFRVSAASAWHTYIQYIENGANYNGNEMNGAPKYIANTEITFRPQTIKGLRMALEWQHLSSYYLDAANTEKYKGFDLLNLRIGYQYKKFEVWINTMNVANAKYATNATKSKWGKSYQPGNPRILNIGLAYKFNKTNI